MEFRCKYPLFLIAFLFFSTDKNQAVAQELPQHLSFSKFTTENGLSDNYVYDIIKDKRGYLWVATQNGIDRFDGVKFTAFVYNPTDSNSLLSNYCEFLTEDSLGRIWVATAGGLSMYNPATGKFWNYKPAELNFQSRVYQVITAHDGSVWFSSQMHLHRVDLKTLKVISYLVPLAISDKSVKSVGFFNEDRNGNLWFSHGYGEAIFDTHTFKVNVVDSIFGFLSFFDDGRNYWVGSWEHPFRRYDPETKSTKDFFFRPDRITLTMRDVVSIEKINYPGMQTYLWLGTNAQLAIFDMESQKFVRYYTHGDRGENNLPTGFIFKVFYDGAGAIWLATEHGLYYTRLTQSAVRTFTFPQTGGLPVMRIREDVFVPSRLWVDFYPLGLYEIDANSGKVIQQFIPEKKPNYMNDFVQDSTGTIWIAIDSGLLRYNPSSGKWKWIATGKDGQKHSYGEKNLVLNKDGTMWLASDAGLGLFDPFTETTQYFNCRENGENDSVVHGFSRICKDDDGNIWAAEVGKGLFEFNPVAEKFRRITMPDFDLSHSPHCSIAQSVDHTIWYSNGEELFFRKKSDTVFHRLYNEKMDGSIYHLLCHGDNVYMAMQNGLLQYNATAGKFIKYTTEDGLYQNRLYDGISMGSNGAIYIYGDGNFITWNSENISNTFPLSPLAFESFTIAYHDSAIDFEKYKNHPLVLSYKQNQFATTFRLLSYTDEDRVKYLYKLGGWDRGWNSTSEGRASYSHLSGGDYILRVKAINPDGTENAQQASMMIHIDTPFWNTSWFYGLCIAALAALLYLIYRLRIQRLLAVQRVRNLISRDLHDDVGSTLTGIIMMSEMGEQSTHPENAEVKSWLHRIGNNSKEMMDNMRDIVWSINPSKDVMLEVVARMKQYAAQLFEAGEVKYFFDVDEKVFTLQLDFVYKRNLYLIFKEAVNNASKYAGCSELIIRLSLRDNKLEMKIADNGKGFNTTENSSGNGLRNMEQRAKQIKGRLFIESAVGKGTQIILIAPLTRIRYWLPKAFR